MAAKKNKLTQFVRDHVERKLVEAGFTPEKACDLVCCCTDAEIEAILPKAKMGAIGDGSFLKLLKEKLPQILDAVNTIAGLLLLFAEKKPVTTTKDEEESDGEEETCEA